MRKGLTGGGLGDGGQDALFWGTGFVVLSKALKLFAVMNLADPKIRPLPDARAPSSPSLPSSCLTNSVRYDRSRS
jgi:hypothetical protein